MTEIFDLHCHTNCSDGALGLGEVIRLASEQGVSVLSVTDHDTVDAYHNLPNTLADNGLCLIPGIEFSTQWKNTGVHVVGLNLNLSSSTLGDAVQYQQAQRLARAEKISAKLEKIGVKDPMERVLEIAGSAGVSRVHFAKLLTERGYVKNHQQAFKRYLGAGKLGDVQHLWADINLVVEWVKSAGGVAVLAHPSRYRLTRTKLGCLVDAFISAGGQAIEILSGSQTKDVTHHLVQLANEKGLYGSLGSDFHSPEYSWQRLGMHKALPSSCRPVWDLF